MSENKVHFCMTPTSPGREIPPEQFYSQKAAFLNGAKWELGETIRIRFLDGSPALCARVEKAAREWEACTNLHFAFVGDGPADVRIAFMAGNGSWSYLGTDCRNIPADEPTMNFGWLDDESTDEDVRSVVLHEFGHAIGMIHEHQNPKGGIRWNKPAVIKDLSGKPNYWSAEQIEHNMFRNYDDVDATPVDPTSIMMYPIPASWTEGGYFSAGKNGALSPLDRQKALEVYPK